MKKNILTNLWCGQQPNTGGALKREDGAQAEVRGKMEEDLNRQMLRVLEVS